MKALEDTAARGDVGPFGRAAELIDWTGRPPEDFIRAMELALKVGAHMTARRISEKGAQQYPNHDAIQEYARVLAPPIILRADLPADPGVDANASWLKQHGSEYSGRWIALRGGDLLYSADSLEKLIEKLSGKKDVLLARIP